MSKKKKSRRQKRGMSKVFISVFPSVKTKKDQTLFPTVERRFCFKCGGETPSLCFYNRKQSGKSIDAPLKTICSSCSNEKFEVLIGEITELTMEVTNLRLISRPRQ